MNSPTLIKAFIRWRNCILPRIFAQNSEHKATNKMAIKITEECINCGACEPECPNNAIYEGGAEWRFADGTGVKGMYTGKNSGIEVNAEDPQVPKHMDVYFIVSDKCTECK